MLFLAVFFFSRVKISTKIAGWVDRSWTCTLWGRSEEGYPDQRATVPGAGAPRRQAAVYNLGYCSHYSLPQRRRRCCLCLLCEIIPT